MKIQTILKTITGFLMCGLVLLLLIYIGKRYHEDVIPLADRLHKESTSLNGTELIDRIKLSARYGSFEITVGQTPTKEQIKYLTDQKFTLEYLTLPNPNDLSKLDTLSTTIKW